MVFPFPLNVRRHHNAITTLLAAATHSWAVMNTCCCNAVRLQQRGKMELVK
jgi:hypothetical protein